MPQRQRGFTVVELIVVVAIIAILAALLLPALGGARKRARKGSEMSDLRQVGVASTLYSNAHDDRTLPGYLPPNVQQPGATDYSWKVTYHYATDDEPVLPVHAGPWTLRLAQYLDYNHDVLLGYRSLDNADSIAISGDIDGNGSIDLVDPAYAPNSIYSNATERPYTASHQPAFGYNAYYVGGWYRLVSVQEFDGLLPKPAFAQAAPLGDSTGRISVVATSVSSIRQTSKMVLFTSSTAAEPGVHESFADDRPGAHFCMPRWMEVPAGEEGPWEGSRYWWAGLLNNQGDYVDSPGIITVQQGMPDAHDINGDGSPDSFAAIPMGRHTGLAAVLHADGHVDTYQPGALEDVQFWINGAGRPGRPVHQRP